jgi:hydroxypyruvate isomerase
VELCRRVDSPAVKLLYDVYHMQVMEGDVIRTIQAHHRSIAHYHTAGNPGRGQPDDTQEIFYPAIYRAIKATGYDGVISHEFLPAGDPLEAMRRAFEECERAMQN